MNINSHDFVTVDMRGLKAALVARAQSKRVSVSVLVRDAVTRELGLANAAADQQAAAPAEDGKIFVRAAHGEQVQSVDAASLRLLRISGDRRDRSTV